MAEEKSPLDLATDFLVYAPLGLALAAGELLPELVDRGRAYLGGQVPMARAVGQMAVRQGQTEAGKVVDQALGQVGAVLEHLLRSWATGGQQPQAPSSATDRNGDNGGSSTRNDPAAGAAPTAGAPFGAAPSAAPEAPPSSPAPTTSSSSTTSPPSAAATGTPSSRSSSGASTSAASGTSTAPSVDALAIADYESLSASQVLPRLAGLSADDLEAVRRYEEAHRGRRTVLGRIATLQGSA